MKKKQYVRWVFLLLAAAVLSAAVWIFLIYTETPKDSSDAVKTELSSEISDTQKETKEKEYHSSALEDKSETVYAKADAEGNITEITVENILKNPGGNSPIPDCSTLQDIKNTKGEEEYTLQTDGTLLWDNHGEDISYKGTSDRELPVSVKISYWLNGQPIKPDKLAGKSGHLRMRFDYENHTTDTVTVDGKEVNVQIPFTVFSAMFLPSDIFYNIEVDNGKIASMGEQNMVIGYACPGLLDSLKLKDYEPSEEIDIPEYVELTADVSGFELEFTATVISSGLFKDMDTDDLEDAEDLIDDMKELTDASEELVDGVGELFDGVVELQDGIKEYVDGARAVDEGVAVVKDALDILDDQKVPLREGASALQSGLEALGSDMESLSAALASLQESYGEEEPPAEIGTIADALSTLKSTVHQLAEGSRQLSEGVGAYTHGVSELYRGSLELSEGAAELAEAGDELNNGLVELVDGVQELKDGVKEFDEEGIKSLADLAGDDLAAVIRSIRALKAADSHYQNFSGIQKGQTGSVKFIIETEKISF